MQSLAFAFPRFDYLKIKAQRGTPRLAVHAATGGGGGGEGNEVVHAVQSQRRQRV